MLHIILLLILLLPLSIILTWYFLEYHYCGQWKNLSGPRTYPIIGNILEIIKNPNNALVLQQELFKQYGKIYPTKLGFLFGLAIADVDLIEQITASNKLTHKSHLYTFVKPWLKNGLILSAGEYWRSKRKLLTPAYHFKILENFVETFERNSDILVGKLRVELNSNYFDIHDYGLLCSLDIICETAMGTSINAQLDAKSTFVKAIKTLSACLLKRILTPLQHNSFFYSFTQNYRDEQHALQVVEEFRNEVIEKRRVNLLNDTKRNEAGDDNDDEFGIKKRKVFLDLLLQATVDGKPLTDAEINEEVDSFMFAGHDTVSTTIAFVLYCISNHPEVQQKIMEEQDFIFENDKNRRLTYNDLQAMKYLEMVIKETLRLYPPVPYVGREATEDFQYNDLLIKKGSQLQLFFYGVHRDPDYFHDPEKFDPERFTLENQAARNAFSFLSFSAGPRNCIGQRFAMLEAKTILSKVLRAYEILPTVPMHVPELNALIVLQSLNGIKIRIKERQ